MMSASPLLELDQITCQYPRPALGLFRPAPPPLRVLDGVSLALSEGAGLALIGAPGSGKTSLGRIAIGLLAPSSGMVRFGGHDLAHMDRPAQQQLRRQTQIVFSQPFNAFDPHFSLYQSLAEPLQAHTDLHGPALDERVLQLLAMVSLTQDILGRYPHELRPAQLQRAAVGRAMALRPRLLVLDDPLLTLEPLARIALLRLLQGLRRKHSLAYLFLTRQPLYAAGLSEDSAVLLSGRIVERLPSPALAQGEALHPYTQALVADAPAEAASPPPPQGCAYHARCPLVRPICYQLAPPLRPIAPQHSVACHAVIE